MLEIKPKSSETFDKIQSNNNQPNMPNYCTNYLIMGGNTEVLKDLWEKYFAQLTFNQHGMFLQLLCPMPDLEESEIHDWRLSNWGTKWEATDMHGVHFDNDILIFEFETAWSPPVEAVKYFCSWFGVHGRLHYYDLDSDFVGFYDSANDKNCELEFNSHDVNTEDMMIKIFVKDLYKDLRQDKLYKHLTKEDIHNAVKDHITDCRQNDKEYKFDPMTQEDMDGVMEIITDGIY